MMLNMQKVGIIVTIVLINNYLEDLNSKGENLEERLAPLQISSRYFLTLVFHVWPMFLALQWYCGMTETNLPQHNAQKTDCHIQPILCSCIWYSFTYLCAFFSHTAIIVSSLWFANRPHRCDLFYICFAPSNQASVLPKPSCLLRSCR